MRTDLQSVVNEIWQRLLGRIRKLQGTIEPTIIAAHVVCPINLENLIAMNKFGRRN
jgi:hypothetical protein